LNAVNGLRGHEIGQSDTKILML